VRADKNSILQAVYKNLYLIAKDAHEILRGEKKKIKNYVEYDLTSLNKLISPLLENSWKGYMLKC